MADFSDVPVVEIHSDNFTQMWPTLLLAMKSSTFIALDAEFSGIGERRKLFAKSIKDRYKGMCEVAKTRSVVSLGLSCFRQKQTSSVTMETLAVSGQVAMDTPPSSDQVSMDTPPSSGQVAMDTPPSSGQVTIETPRCSQYDVQTFNIFLLCSENYVVEPLSLRFLVDHGFDFNRQYSQGLPYYRGNDKREDLYGGKQTIRELFTHLSVCKVPVVLHNGLVDLVFLYQNFYAELPASMQTFLADMEQIFPGGIYDTKYITEYKARLNASFLEYVFRKCQRDNFESSSKGWSHVQLSFLRYPARLADQIVLLPCGIHDRMTQNSSTTPCEYFASHGWCSAGAKCPKSHDVDVILDNEARSRKRKRRQEPSPETSGKRTSCVVKTEDIGSDVISQDSDSTADIKSEDIHSIGDVKIETDAKPNRTSKHDVIKTENDVVNHNGDVTDSNEITHFTTSGDTRDKTNDVINDVSVCRAEVQKSRTAGHRAGFDAFMTGFIFSFFSARFSEGREFRNRVFLSGKDIPLQISKSNFVKLSQNHIEKSERINKTR